MPLNQDLTCVALQQLCFPSLALNATLKLHDAAQ